MSGGKKGTEQGLNVLGYDNVKSVAVQPKVRQELDYLDREVRWATRVLRQDNPTDFLFPGTSSRHCLSIRSAEKTWHTFERSGKLHRRITAENSRTMSDDTSSRIIHINVVLPLKTLDQAYTLICSPLHLDTNSLLLLSSTSTLLLMLCSNLSFPCCARLWHSTCCCCSPSLPRFSNDDGHQPISF